MRRTVFQGALQQLQAVCHAGPAAGAASAGINTAMCRGLATSSGLLLPHPSQRRQGEQQPLLSQLPSLQALLVKALSPSSSPRWGQSRGMAGGPPGAGPHTEENTWIEYRTKYAFAKKNDLGQAMMALILTFGFSAVLIDLFAYPSRVITMMGLVFCECLGCCYLGSLF